MPAIRPASHSAILQKILSGALATFAAVSINAAEIVVCPTSNAGTGCDFSGKHAIQSAVDSASNGDTVFIRAGSYSPDAYRDVGFEHLVIRGYVLLEGKTLGIRGEDGTVLDGSNGQTASAFIVNNGAATFDTLTIQNFRASSADDELYDGHGIFIIDSKAKIENVRFRRIPKMSVSIRGASDVKIINAEIVDGHVGIWTEENVTLSVENTLFRNNDSAGIAAYATSSVRVVNSVFEGNLDDGIYAENDAIIDVANSLFIGNKPFAIRGVDDTRIAVDYSVFHGNEENLSNAGDAQQIRAGPKITDTDPVIGHDYWPSPGSPLIDAGDPSIFDHDDSVSDIGLHGGPAASSTARDR